MSDAKLLHYGNPFLIFSNMSLAGTSLAAAGDQIELMFQAKEDCTITRLGYSCTATTTPPVYIVSLQGITTAGAPDGTILGGGSPASGTFTPSVGFAWVTLVNAVNLTRGTWYFMVIAYSSGTIDGTHKASFVANLGATNNLNHPLFSTFIASVRTKFAGPGAAAYASINKAYGYPCSAASSQSFGSSSSPNEYGIKFTIPAGWCNSYKLLGARVITATVLANANTIMTLYSGTDTSAANSTGAVSEKTSQQTLTINENYGRSSSFSADEYFFNGTNLVTLYSGATYRLGFAPQTTDLWWLTGWSVATASDFDAYQGMQDFASTSRTSAGNWTDVATTRYVVDLILDDITGGSGPSPFIKYLRAVA